MQPATVDYAPPSPRSQGWPTWATYVAIMVVLGVGLVVVTSVTASVWVLQIDAVTGTTTTRTTWPLGISSGDVVNVSPLELRLKASGIPWTADWRFMSENGRTIAGVVTYRGCSTAPPIYQIRPVLKKFADASTDAELREFVRVMQTGTDAEQAAAVDAAGEKVFGRP